MLEEELAAISTITPKAELFQRFRIAITLFSLCLMVIVFITTEKWTLTVSGFLLIALLIWSLADSMKSKHLDSNTKKSLWFVGVVLLAVFTRIVIAWINPEVLN